MVLREGIQPPNCGVRTQDKSRAAVGTQGGTDVGGNSCQNGTAAYFQAGTLLSKSF